MPYTAPSVGSCNNSQDTLVGSPCPPQILYFPSVITIDSICDKNSVAAFVEELQEIDEDCEFQPLPLPNDSDYDSPNIGEFNQLLDLSIRNLITPAPVGSISAIQKDLSTHLSELAPSIFSLGYSEVSNLLRSGIADLSRRWTNGLNSSHQLPNHYLLLLEEARAQFYTRGSQI